MLFLYQVGDLPLYDSLRGPGGKGIQIDMSSEWRDPTQKFSGISGQHSYAPLTHGILDKNSISVKGAVYPTKFMDAEEFQNMLFSIGGRRNIPIIAFRYVENYNSTAQYIDWLVNYGMVNKVPRKQEYMSEDNIFAPLTAEIQFDIDNLGLKWRRLSPWLWEYRRWADRVIDPNSSLLAASEPSNKFVHPQKFAQILPDRYFFLYDTTLTDFSPAFWGVKYEEEPNDGGFGSNWVGVGTFEFFSDPLRWSAPPSSVYAFTNLATSGTLSIAVQRTTGFFANQVVEEISTLDLAIVDSDLNAVGYGGLRSDDIIITGLVAPQPGFVLRDGSKIEAARPKWDYPATYPGEASRGYNKVTLQADGLNPQVAFLHEFGVIG